MRATGRDQGLQLSQTVQFLYRRRYNLTATDPRYLDATLEDMILDLWAHAHIDNPKLREEIVAEGFDEEVAAMEAEALARTPVKVVGEEDWEPVADQKYGPS